VLLNYAEAMYEAYSPDSKLMFEVVEAVYPAKKNN
jgi:hypothetical protein